MKIDTQLKVNQNLKCVFSNRFEILADLLAGNLFARQTAVFERRYVVVPNETIGEFLVFHLASTLQIAAGFSLLSLDQAIAQLLQSCDLFQRVPSFLELSLMIEEKLHLGLRTCSSLFTQVDEYLFSQDPESEQSQKKLIALSQQLAQLFIRYGTYAKAFLPQWLMQKGWQQWLWLQIFSEKSPFISLMAALHGRYVQEAQVHLFGFSYLPPCYLPFFSESCAVLYQFSPCSHYWQDFCSDRQRLSLMRHLDAKGAKREIKEQMDHYLQESHPLLANWGRLGREFLQQLDAYDLDTQEHYVPEGNTLLGRIKNSLLHLEVMESVDSDDSIQVHSATSKLREIEVLCELIHTLLVRHATDALPLQPRDILILAADITEYAPYIHAVFSNTQIAYRIDGLEEGSRSDFAQAFFYFFSLSEQEFSLDAVFKLFLMPAFRKRCGLSVDEIDEVYQWLKYAQVRSGQKSWQEAIDRLLWGLAMQIDEQGIKSHPLYPLSCIGQTQIEIFDKFLVCFLSVKEALDQLQAKGKMSLSEWMQWLFDLSCKLFDCDLENDPLLTALQALSIKHLQSKHWTFLSVQRILRALYEKRTAHIEAQHLQSLHFCSLQSGSVRPSRLIYVLGLDEGKFPRYEPKLALCALTSGPNPPYIPTQADKDRYLFLELLCHARDYYILSYERIHAEDNKPQGPSYLIEELLHYAKGVIKVLDSERMIPNPENVFELGEKTSLSSSCVRSPFFLPL